MPSNRHQTLLLAALLLACTRPNRLYQVRVVDSGTPFDAAAGMDAMSPPPDLAWYDTGLPRDTNPPPDLPPDVPPPPDLAGDLPPDLVPPGVDLNAGLLGYWKFDETSGTMAADSSGNNHHGTVEYISPQPTWVGGYNGGRSLLLPADAAMSASGVRVTATAAIRTMQQFTIAAWTRRTDLDTNRVMTLMSRQIGALSAEVFNLAMDGAVFRIWIQSPDFASRGAYAGGPISMPLNRWVHLAATYNGSTIVLYVDGSVYGSMPYAGGMITTETNPLYIGTNKNDLSVDSYHSYWEGNLDDVLLYSVAHDAQTIRALWQGARPNL